MEIETLIRAGLMLASVSVPLLFAVFTAYWAQTTGRNAWLWFAFGLLLAPVAGLLLLWKNAKHYPEPPRLSDPGRPDLLSIQRGIP